MKILMVVLVVDDDPIYVKAYQQKLTNSGFEVKVARDGEEGLKIALSEHPDLILLDLMMSKMDGMTMMRRLRQEDAWGQTVPIIILTNLDADAKTLLGVVKDHPAYYIMKTESTPEDIVEKIREVLKPPSIES